MGGVNILSKCQLSSSNGLGVIYNTHYISYNKQYTIYYKQFTINLIQYVLNNKPIQGVLKETNPLVPLLVGLNVVFFKLPCTIKNVYYAV